LCCSPAQGWPQGPTTAAHLHARGRAGFAGHPTLGSCHAWLAQGGQPRNPEQVLQGAKRPGAHWLQCARRSFRSTLLDSQEISEEELAPVLQALGLQREQLLMARSLDNGSPWLGLLLDHPDTVLAWSPILRAQKLDAKAGLAAIYEVEEDAPLIGRSSREARAFAKQAEEAVQEKVTPAQPRLEVRALIGETASEDPVTGSLNAALAQWLTGEVCCRRPISPRKAFAWAVTDRFMSRPPPTASSGWAATP
jgi:predicted PhzF superfamily epimerase YddE/YHI9